PGRGADTPLRAARGLGAPCSPACPCGLSELPRKPERIRRYGIVTTPPTGSIEGRIAEELGVRERQVRAAVELLDGGSTVPFIARYRKEATEMLDDAQLRAVEERLRYLRELEDRRTAILESVREQGKLTEELEARIRGA